MFPYFNDFAPIIVGLCAGTIAMWLLVDDKTDKRTQAIWPLVSITFGFMLGLGECFYDFSAVIITALGISVLSGIVHVIYNIFAKSTPNKEQSELRGRLSTPLLIRLFARLAGWRFMLIGISGRLEGSVTKRAG
jgi:hypothetical protein